jgi:hypothetical protein
MRIPLVAVSFGLSVVAAIVLLTVPIYSQSNRPVATLLQVNGPWGIVPVIFPLMVALFPSIIRARGAGITAAILLSGFVLVGSFSIGLLYLPSAATMWFAVSAPSYNLTSTHQ